MIFDGDYINAVVNKMHYDFGNTSEHYDYTYSWERLIKLLDGTPKDLLRIGQEKLKFQITAINNRPSRPEFVKSVCRDLEHVFYRNNISCHIFGGLTKESRSFDVHKDKMDVLYVQNLGTAKVQICVSLEDAPNIPMSACSVLHERTFKQGDMIWIPRGTYHQIVPLSSRIGFSFGVEGDIDPSTYIS